MKLWSGLLVSLIAAGALVAPAAAQNVAKPAIVYSTGGKFEKSFNEGVSQGAQRFNKETDAIAALAYDAVKGLADAMTRAGSTDGPKVRDALATADVAGVTGQLKMNRERNVDKPAVVQEVTYANGQVKFVYKTTVNPG
jgi:ABC-type branched-subunit amino acid transport system substrate-binding protein